MDLNGQLTKYLEEKDGDRAKKEKEMIEGWLRGLGQQMNKKVKEMMEEGLNSISIKFCDEMMPYQYKMSASKIADYAGIDWRLIGDYEYDRKSQELYITFNFRYKD